MSRLPLLPPSQLQGDQKAFYDELTKLIDDHFGHSFTTKSATDSAFIGPFGVFMHTPQLGRSFFATMLALSSLPMGNLSPSARETAILVVGGHYQARYEVYAHEKVARKTGLSADQIGDLVKGVKPRSLDVQGDVAFDVAKGMLDRLGVLDAGLYGRAVEVLGQEGAVALIHFVGFYAYTCLVLNGFDVGVSDE